MLAQPLETLLSKRFETWNVSQYAKIIVLDCQLEEREISYPEKLLLLLHQTGNMHQASVL